MEICSLIIILFYKGRQNIKCQIKFVESHRYFGNVFVSQVKSQILIYLQIYESHEICLTQSHEIYVESRQDIAGQREFDNKIGIDGQCNSLNVQNDIMIFIRKIR